MLGRRLWVTTELCPAATSLTPSGSFPTVHCGGFYHCSFGERFGFKSTLCWKVAEEKDAGWCFRAVQALGGV